MPSNTFAITLSLKDADAVKRGLQQLGADGEGALKRLEAATTPASRGLQLLDQASGAVRGGMQELAARSGPAGQALELLGKGGLAAAAGLGAVALAVRAAVTHANNALQVFADLADSAARIGTSASTLRALEYVFESNASSAEELRGALEFLRAKIGEAAAGNPKAQQSFEDVGISMGRLSQIGGDAGLVLVEIARKTGLTSNQVADLTGRVGKGLMPALTALRENGIGPVDKSLDDVAGRMGAVRDRTGELAKRWEEVGANDAVRFQEAVLTVKEALIDLVGWLDRSGEASANWWKQQWSQLGGRPAEPSKSLSNLQQSVTDRLSQMRTAGPPAAPAPIKINPPDPSGGGGGRRPGGGGRANPLGLEMTTFSTQGLGGFSLDPVETTVLEPSYAFKQHAAEADAFYETLSKITEQTTAAKDETAAWYDQITLNTLGIHEAASSLGGLFADAATGEKKVADVLAEIPNLIAKIIIQKTFELAITQAIAAVSKGSGGGGIGGALAGLIGSIGSIAGAAGGAGGAGYGTTGAGGNLTSGGTNPGFLLGGAARGAVFDAGNVIPFARGGLVDQPTLFPMARGMGLMGEAGPEAVMPLKRTASGDLGVRSAAPVVKVTVNNNGSAQVNKRTQQDDNGNLEVIFDIVEQRMAAQAARPGTRLNRAIGAAGSPLTAR